MDEGKFMFIKLDQDVIEILCCPFCKDDLYKSSSGFACVSCGLSFPLKSVAISETHLENIYDFRLNWPSYCAPKSKALWQETQVNYEQFSDDFGSRDSLQEYLDEIDSVKEIYTEEFSIHGSVLDVGGHQGRLRYFFDNTVTQYVSIDPYIGVFRGIDKQPNLLKAYPSLAEPCNFLAAHAEYLPFKSRSFDWVHMRSVVDHFEDPYRAFLEAYRVSKVEGRLLVGLAILEKIQNVVKVGELEVLANENASTMQTITQTNVSPLKRIYLKWKNGGWGELYRAALWRILPAPPRPLPLEPEPQIEVVEIQDDHMYRFTHSQLIDLMERTGWKVTKQHWQKPPYYYCIYAMGEARPPQKDDGDFRG
jgi:ubiquinone/menaquinone biosynthesis C-methylase UbiE